MPVGNLYKKKIWKNFFLASESHWRKESDPDPLIRDVDPGPHQNVTDPHHFWQESAPPPPQPRSGPRLFSRRPLLLFYPRGVVARRQGAMAPKCSVPRRSLLLLLLRLPVVWSHPNSRLEQVVGTCSSPILCVADPGPFFDPGIRKRFCPDPGSQTHIFASLITSFF